VGIDLQPNAVREVHDLGFENAVHREAWAWTMVGVARHASDVGPPGITLARRAYLGTGSPILQNVGRSGHQVDDAARLASGC
jgi:hypothetical protein